jgi:twitching motility two-component system response regulator PilH
MSAILIVDDSNFQRTIIKSSIAGLVDTIMEASTGTAGLETALGNRFDCITLDLGLPEMTGFEVLAALQARGPHPPVIVISADIQETSKTRCLELGAHTVLQKPVSKPLLRSVISDVLAATKTN